MQNTVCLAISPLEQFNVVMVVPALYISNFLVAGIVGLLFQAAPLFLISKVNPVFPVAWQTALEAPHNFVVQVASYKTRLNSKKFSLVMLVIFNFVIISNVVGLLPYSFTTTSHFTVTFFIAFSMFIGNNLLAFEKYAIKMFNFFIPSNGTVALSAVLVPIEFISHLSKPISLSVRLFVNLMAGHTLLKVIMGFSWDLLTLEKKLSWLLFLPTFLIIGLFALECAVAFIQAYVFLILLLGYLRESS